MTKPQSIPFWLVKSGAFFYMLISSPVTAQIVPDATLPVSSSVSPLEKTSIIDGGTRAGSNLFHSFEQFSVPTGSTAYFNNALDIQNIISRVTGGSVSNIDGLLRANGTANLFLINPNGIIFGPNASLNIGGSFLASTANSLNFADGTQFSASARSTTPLLTVSVPLGLQFGGNAGRIIVQGNGQGLRITSELIDTTVGLRVEPNQTLALVGGDVVLEGATLKTAGGRIELGSVAGNSLVNLTAINKGWTLGYSDVPAFGDIQLAQQAAVDASGVGGGDVQMRGRRIMLATGSLAEASTIGSEPGGMLSVTASESVELSGTSADGRFPSALLASAKAGATGSGGNLNIETGRLSVRDGGQIGTGTFGTGSAGTLVVNARESVELIGTTTIGQRPSGLFTSAQRRSTGAGGNLTLGTGRLSVRDGAQISASTFGTGSAGTLVVNAKESVELSGTSANGQRPSGLFTSVEVGATGAGGNLTLGTGRLSVRDGAQISARTFGTGSAGTLVVNAKESVELSARSVNDQFDSGLFTSVEVGATGAGGNLTLETGRLSVRDGAQIQAATFGEGSAGNLAVNAKESVEVIGTSVNGTPSVLTSRTRDTGDAGDLSIETGQLTVRDGAEVSVSSEGSGDAGNLEITSRSIRLDNQGKLTADTTAGQGNIILRSGDLVLRRGSNITTNATGIVTGGNITLDTDILTSLENSDISANAQKGSGGRVIINTQGIFGAQFRDVPTPESDITATGGSPELNGTVQINTLDTDPSRGLVTVPTEPVDAAGLIAQGCPATVGLRASKFIVTGRGGLPDDPNKPLNTKKVWADAHLITPVENQPSLPPSSATQPTDSTAMPLVEATGWTINDKGEVVLTAAVPTATLQVPWLTSNTCHAS